MAESVFDHESPLNCPICLNQFKDPVTTSCGHSFCMDCINRCWDQDCYRGVYSCPTCRTTFNQRPALSRNTVLADMCCMLEGMKLEAPAGPGDVTCDFCTVRKGKAIKSCLVCMASYCQTHLRPHYESEAFKKHKLVKASPNLQQQICPQHHKALEVYCYNDQKCVCVVCMGNQHSGHRTVSAADEMAKNQEELKIKQRDFLQLINDRDKEVQQSKKNLDLHKRSAQAAVEHSDKIFSEIICSIQKRHAEVRENIRAQKNKEVQDAENHIQTLEKEICELQEENRKLEPLLQTEDHVYFFQNYSCSALYQRTASPKEINNILTFENVKEYVSELKNQLDKLCGEHMSRISKTVSDVQIFKKSSEYGFPEQYEDLQTDVVLLSDVIRYVEEPMEDFFVHPGGRGLFSRGGVSSDFVVSSVCVASVSWAGSSALAPPPPQVLLSHWSLPQPAPSLLVSFGLSSAVGVATASSLPFLIFFRECS